ncbi:hypothetical protein [Luminiphilus syltensis]|uniref:hypothetical protein n=1 Tax=Luminiphilus syltensis TaxID=1341119 RepID=UPI0012B64144|nr:hypothetical protein [Luminiphilus syltensis]
MNRIKVSALLFSMLFCSQTFAQSEGCNIINGIAVLPAFVDRINGAPRAYLAGETISATAAAPGSTTNLVIEENGVVVATAAFPGTVSYRVPTSGTFTIDIGTDPNAQVTFTNAVCTVPSVSVPTTPLWSLAFLALSLLILVYFGVRRNKVA